MSSVEIVSRIEARGKWGPAEKAALLAEVDAEGGRVASQVDSRGPRGSRTAAAKQREKQARHVTPHTHHRLSGWSRDEAGFASGEVAAVWFAQTSERHQGFHHLDVTSRHVGGGDARASQILQVARRRPMSEDKRRNIE